MTEVREDGLQKALYDFDATNMMVGAAVRGKGTAEYGYNGFRNRVRKLETLEAPNAALPDPTREIRYTLDLTKPYDNLLMTRGSSNQGFVWGNSLIEANGDEGFFCLQDHLGSPIRLLGADGDSRDALAYDEFGVPLAGTGGSLHNPFGFTGYQVEDVAGLYFAQARYYLPNLCRFSAEDTHWYPANMLYGDSLLLYSGMNTMPDMLAIQQSRNLYSYSLNNPINYVDYDGHIVGTIIGAIGGAIVGGISAAIQGTDILTGITSGAVSGAIVGAASDILFVTGGTGAVAVTAMAAGGWLGGAAGSIIDQVGNQWLWGEGVEFSEAINNIDSHSVRTSAKIGAVAGAFTGLTGQFLDAAHETSKLLFKSTLYETVLNHTVINATREALIRSSWSLFFVDNSAGLLYTAFTKIAEALLLSKKDEQDIIEKE